MPDPRSAQWVGWSAAIILLLTVGRQVWTQWRTRSGAGLSRWLFVGQITASIGFVIYSWLLQNWVFLVTNSLMLVTAMFGQWVFLRDRGKPRPDSTRRDFIGPSDPSE